MAAQHRSVSRRDDAVPAYATLKDAIREEIIVGRFPPGVRLKIGRLAEQFGTSTMPVRQALQDLHAEGLVVLLPNRGASVRRVDEHLAECIYDVRKYLIALVLERCVMFITNSDLIELDQLELQMHKTRNPHLIVQASEAFFRRIFQIARNELAMDVLNNIWPLISALRRHYGVRDQRAVHDNNRALLRALQRRDASEAVRIAQKSCEESKDDLIGRLRGSAVG